MVIAQGMRRTRLGARLEEEIASRPKDWQPPPAHETFLRKLRTEFIGIKQDAPSLQRDVDEQEAGRKSRKDRREKERGSGQESRDTTRARSVTETTTERWEID